MPKKCAKSGCKDNKRQILYPPYRLKEPAIFSFSVYKLDGNYCLTVTFSVVTASAVDFVNSVNKLVALNEPQPDALSQPRSADRKDYC